MQDFKPAPITSSAEDAKQCFTLFWPGYGRCDPNVAFILRLSPFTEGDLVNRARVECRTPENGQNTEEHHPKADGMKAVFYHMRVLLSGRVAPLI